MRNGASMEQRLENEVTSPGMLRKGNQIALEIIESPSGEIRANRRRWTRSTEFETSLDIFTHRTELHGLRYYRLDSLPFCCSVISVRLVWRTLKCAVQGRRTFCSPLAEDGMWRIFQRSGLLSFALPSQKQPTKSKPPGPSLKSNVAQCLNHFSSRDASRWSFRWSVAGSVMRKMCPLADVAKLLGIARALSS
ncbi:hypothetical protein EV356DRAFT_32400 [Viridothelium virens]|uniref:Uncharacterized protein n=1 Tax=Viridothelium virens TaxID=1048519 RepID=A0A6A6GTA1_VIRVR|nr:hypothetical protein EV356DRAFT_32400 [Viridothelium virens]